MIRIDRRFKGTLVTVILDSFSLDTFVDFLDVHVEKKLEHYSTRQGFEANIIDTLNTSEQEGWLDTLLEKLREQRTGLPLADLIDKMYAEYNEGLAWYTCENPAHSQFTGRKPFVDRKEIRDSIGDLSGPSMNTVLFVQGELGAGKSYLWNYINYMLRAYSPSNYVLIDMDDYPEVHSINDKALMTLILNGLGLGALAAYDETAQSFLRASELIGQLTGRINDREERDRYIVIDSLDNQCLTESGITLLETLALQVGRGNIPGLRIILMGYDGESPTRQRNNVHFIKESIEAIGEPDVQQFFADVAADIEVELDPAIALAAAQRAIELTNEQEANQLHDQIAIIASEIFGANVAGDGQ